MALGKAAGLAMIAAFGLPLIAPVTPDRASEWIAATTLHLPVGGVVLSWNWAAFCVVGVAGWFMLKASEE